MQERPTPPTPLRRHRAETRHRQPYQSTLDRLRKQSGALITKTYVGIRTLATERSPRLRQPVTATPHRPRRPSQGTEADLAKVIPITRSRRATPVEVPLSSSPPVTEQLGHTALEHLPANVTLLPVRPDGPPSPPQQAS